MTLAAGTILDNRYRIVKLVGQGGFGAVYRAWHMSLEQPVAIKENIDTGPESQRQFEREAKLLAGLRHPNLPRVNDHFVVPGQGQYLVMDFVEGRSLRDLLNERGGPLDEAEVLPWIRQVCEALDYLHTRTPPIIHRDVKPDNIIITSDGRAVLVDFGISKIFDPGKGTTVGARAVTPGYSPPEQYGRGRTDARSDVYALGATLYTLLTGQPPPDGPDLASGADVLTPPRQANPAVSAATSAAVVAALAPTISQRLGGAAAFAGLLPVAAAPAKVRTPPPAPPPVAPTMPIGNGPGNPAAKRGVPIWGWIGGVIALVALAVWAGMAFGGRNGGGTTPEATVEGPIVMVTAESSVTATHVSPTVTASPSPTNTPRPTPTAEPQAGDIRAVSRGGVEVEQVFVPAGSFLMGSEAGESDEQPAHEVTLDAFWSDRTEVTNAQFAACVAGGACQPPENTSSYTRDQYYGNDEFADYPVIYVSWNDAGDFCAWAGGRLPTEAEWEYAARGPTGRVYPRGNKVNGERLNFCDVNCPFEWADKGVDDGHADTAPVGSYPDGASWVGALDMAGNVWEWVNDWYDSDYYGKLADESPSGPVSGEYRVLRGGAWDGLDNDARSSDRYYNRPAAATSWASGVPRSDSPAFLGSALLISGGARGGCAPSPQAIAPNGMNPLRLKPAGRQGTIG